MTVVESLAAFYSSPAGLRAREVAQRRELGDIAALELVKRMKRSPGSRPQVSYRCTVDGCALLEAYVTPAGIACRLGSARISIRHAGEVRGGSRGQEGRSMDDQTFRLPVRGILLSFEEMREAERLATSEGFRADGGVVVACRHQWGAVPMRLIRADAESGKRATKSRLFEPSVTA
ncbi:hypothetical protein [Geodermatophilus sp. SYSU D01105]